MATLRPTAAPARCLLTQTSATCRAFSTTSSLARQTPTHLKVPLERVPDYPYGPFRWYKQRNSGLYGTSKIRFGNTVSEPRMIKQPTQWRPNRHTKRLWSPSLNMFIRTRLTAHVLKTIDRLGGIDEYLLGTKQRRVKELGPAGWRLRWKVMQSGPVQEKWAREREALGLPPKGFVVEGAEVTPSPEDIAEIDAMLERGDEFVIGEEVVSERFMAEEPVSRAEEARNAAQEVLDEIKSEGELKRKEL
ncbi:54S ribosomal protein L24, mitochondrial [Seiridium cupressi]